jgi:hypothetical protein
MVLAEFIFKHVRPVFHRSIKKIFSITVAFFFPPLIAYLWPDQASAKKNPAGTAAPARVALQVTVVEPLIILFDVDIDASPLRPSVCFISRSAT